jgi:hypothetical protein
MRTRLLIAALAWLASGCSSSAPSTADTGPDRGLPAPDGPQVPRTWKFTPEDTGQSPAVAMKLESLAGDEATLVLVGRGMSALQGIAFRLTFPPQQVTVSRSEVGAAWAASGHPVLSRFAPRSEGELWGGVGHQGPHGLAAEDGAELARIKLHLSGDLPVTLGFRAQHNLALDPGLKRLTVSWLGGSFALVAPP